MPIEMTQFPVVLICQDFNIYLELPGWSPDNGFPTTDGNLKNKVSQDFENFVIFLLRL